MYIKVNDIRYTNNGKGEPFTSKIGAKYEYRKNKIYECIPLPDAPSEYGLDLIEVDEDGQPTGYRLETTPFVKASSNAKGDVCILTKNSIHNCTDVTGAIKERIAMNASENKELKYVKRFFRPSSSL